VFIQQELEPEDSLLPMHYGNCDVENDTANDSITGA